MFWSASPSDRSTEYFYSISSHLLLNQDVRKHRRRARISRLRPQTRHLTHPLPKRKRNPHPQPCHRRQPRRLQNPRLPQSSRQFPYRARQRCLRHRLRHWAERHKIQSRRSRRWFRARDCKQQTGAWGMADIYASTGECDDENTRVCLV